MKFRSWLSTCSTTAAAAPSPPPKSLQSITSSPFSDDVQSLSSSSTTTTIHSNLSLLTLPSVPSLQRLLLSPDTAATSVFLTSIQSNGRRAGINFLALHNNLLYVASGNEITSYEIVNNTLFDAFNVGNHISTGSVKSIAFCDGKVFTAHQDCKIRVWKLNDRKQHKLVATLPTLEDRLRRFILPQNYINVRRHKKKLWIEHHDAVSGLATGENGNLVVSISWDKSIKIWEPRKFQCLESISRAHDDAINAVVISKDGLIYTGSADKRIKVWKKEGKKYGAIATLEKHKSAVNALALSPDGSVLFSGSCDRSILVWEREDSANHMAVTGALRGHAKAILCLVTVRDLLLSGSSDGTMRVWQRGGGGDGVGYLCLKVLEWGHHRRPVKSLVAEAGGGGSAKVYSGSMEGEIKVWQMEIN